MIHLLEISPELSPAQVKKISRRYAMTGGYELVLQPGLTSIELERLVDLYLPIALEYDRSDARFRSNNAYRILKLVSAAGALSARRQAELESSLIGDKQV